jgi:hypothetical protein
MQTCPVLPGKELIMKFLGKRNQWTDATQTVQLDDGTFAFCDGLGDLWREVAVMIPGYPYVYGRAVASQKHKTAHSALDGNATFPTGSKIVYLNKVTIS